MGPWTDRLYSGGPMPVQNAHGGMGIESVRDRARRPDAALLLRQDLLVRWVELLVAMTLEIGLERLGTRQDDLRPGLWLLEVERGRQIAGDGTPPRRDVR